MTEKKAVYKNNTETKRRFTRTQLELLGMARLARREKCKSLGDLVNLRKDLDDKLDGRIRMSSALPARARRLGLLSADKAKSVKSQNFSQTLQQLRCLETTQECLTSLHKQNSFTPPPSPDNSLFFKKIVKEQTTHTSGKQELTKVRLGDILHSASLMEMSCLSRSTSLVCCRPLCNHAQVKTGRNSESAFSLGHFRPNRKRIVVRMPSVYDIGESSCQRYFSYRHKK